jgi:hypothetical protein
VQNHVLFEVATEVANRGSFHPNSSSTQQVLTQSSWRYLLSPQVEGASHYSRIWRLIHSAGSLEQGIGRRITAATESKG